MERATEESGGRNKVKRKNRREGKYTREKLGDERKESTKSVINVSPQTARPNLTVSQSKKTHFIHEC